MHIVLISECQKKAWKTTRRIVSQYLPQNGSRVWIGGLDEEGLEELHKELRRTATRSTSIICFRLTSKSTKRIAFLVGNRSNFDYQGQYAFSVIKRDLPYEQKDWPFMDYLALTVQFAGLCHDLAKALHGFQKKLRDPKANRSDPIRHDLLSLYWLIQILEPKVPQIRKMHSSTWEQHKYILDYLLHNSNLDIQGDRLALNKQYFDPIKFYLIGHRLGPFLSHISMLILSHHFLPYVDNENHNNLTSRRYVNSTILKEANYINSLSDEAVSWYPDALLPWQDKKWLKSWTSTLENLKDERFSAFLNNNLPHHTSAYIFLLGRPALVAADQCVSALGNQRISQSDNNQCYANTIGMKAGQLAQPLTEHLLQVAKNSNRFVRQLRGLWDGRLSDKVSEIPKSLKKNTIDPRFMWQNESCQVAKKIAKESKPLDGFFGVMLAETGSGKTRCIPRFMSYLNPNQIRFTLALGLRTLTEQSGKAYADPQDIGFELNRDVSVLIGGHFRAFDLKETKSYNSNDNINDEPNISAIQDLATDMFLAQDDPIKDILGKEDWDRGDSCFPEFQLKTQKDKVLASLAGPLSIEHYDRASEKFIFQQRLAKMLQVPVLVCTIDHLMAGLTGQKSSDAKRLSRIFTSDLVIDEMDSFCAEDIKALTRLVFFTGLSGRKVLISSATITPILSQLLFKAYHNGYQIFYDVQNIDKSKGGIIHTAWLSNYKTSVSKLNLSESIQEEFSKHHNHFIAQLEKILQKQPARRKTDFLDIAGCNNTATATAKEKLCNKLSKKINELHQEHGVVNKGKKLSVGLIRISNTRPAMAVFNGLLDLSSKCQTEEKCRSFIFYQAKHLDSNLENIEELLNRILSRKHTENQTDPIFKQDEIKNWMSDHPDCTNFQVIVIATPIEEVGRDHDFDWCIIEPTSNWSLIQTAGRIWRHRSFKTISESMPANMCCLSHPLFYNKPNFPIYSRPGPCSKNFQIQKDSDDLIPSAMHLFDFQVTHKIDSRLCINQSSKVDASKTTFEKLSEVEFISIFSAMNELFDGKNGDFYKILTYVSNYFEKKYPFRDNSGAYDVKIIIDPDDIKSIFLESKEIVSNNVVKSPISKMIHLEDCDFLLNYGKGYDENGVIELQCYNPRTKRLFRSDNVDDQQGYILVYHPITGGTLRKRKAEI